MCPVNCSAFWVPLILAEKSYVVASLEGDNSRCQVNIVGDQDCLARFKLNDKSLMPGPFVIVRQESSNFPRALDLKIALVLIECASKPLVTFANSPLGTVRGRRHARAEHVKAENHGKQSEFMHVVKSFIQRV
jgi:hypothetical protein